jgi:cytochrome subunit of sulfide dehydrogenase
MKPKPSRWLLAALLLPVAAPLVAQVTSSGATALRERALAASCAQCHGTDGRAAAGSTLPALAGQPAAYLADQMQAFKAGSRPGTVMPQLAKGYTDAQIAQLAAYFSRTALSQP